MEVTTAAHESEASNAQLPPCYGLYWEALGDSPCTKCEVRRGCLHSFATTELPRLQSQLGDNASDVTKLASVSQVKPGALRVALAYASKAATREQETEGDSAANGAGTSATEGGRETARTKPQRKRKSRRRRRPWGRHTFKARWLRERERCPALAALTPGHSIVRKYKGVEHTVKVLHGRYVYDGKEYPTLYEVTKAITGTRPANKQRRAAGDESSRPEGKRQLCSWSATRFFAAALAALN
jgi:hypothetical protein